MLSVLHSLRIKCAALQSVFLACARSAMPRFLPALLRAGSSWESLSPKHGADSSTMSGQHVVSWFKSLSSIMNQQQVSDELANHLPSCAPLAVAFIILRASLSSVLQSVAIWHTLQGLIACHSHRTRINGFILASHCKFAVTTVCLPGNVGGGPRLICRPPGKVAFVLLFHRYSYILR